MDYKKARDKLIAAEDCLTRHYLRNGCAITDAAAQREFERMIEDLSLGQNFVRFDDAGQPAIYWAGPPGRERLHDWLSDRSTRYQIEDTLPMHQSFYIDNAAINWYMAKYQMGSVDGVAKPVSLRGLLPAHSISMSAAQALAKTRGGNDSLCTWSAYDFMAKWAERKRYDPYGNTAYGRDDRDATVHGICQHVYPNGLHNRNGMVLTGTMGDKSALDGTCFTPHDIVGNVWEHAIGKMTNKYILVIPQNGAALLSFGTPGAGLEADSAEWRKISDTLGTFMARTDDGGLLLDFVGEKGSNKPFCISDAQNNPPDNADQYGGMAFTDLTVRGVPRFPLLEQYGIIKGSDGAGNFLLSPGGRKYARFMEGRAYVEFWGGSCNIGSSARLRAAIGFFFGSYAYWNVGARLELVEKP